VIIDVELTLNRWGFGLVARNKLQIGCLRISEWKGPKHSLSFEVNWVEKPQGKTRRQRNVERQEAARLRLLADDDRFGISKIEVDFAIPVQVSQAQIKRIHDVVDQICDGNVPSGKVHWPSGYGSKPHFSEADCKFLGKQPEPGSPATGEPTWSDDVFYIETCCRDDYEQEGKMRQGDRTIYALKSGKMQMVQSPMCSPEKSNFVIVCELGDWSGFRTLEECERQFPELESKGKPDGFYSVVER
jgi:hypothetical protein